MPGGVSGRLPGSCPAHARQVQPGLNVPPGGREAPLSLAQALCSVCGAGRPRAARSVTDSLDRNPHCLALSAASFLLSGRRQRAGSETGTLSRPEPKHLVQKPGGSDRVRVPICAPSVMGPRTPALCAPEDFWTHAACPAHRGLGRMNRGDEPLCAGETGVARSPPGPSHRSQPSGTRRRCRCGASLDAGPGTMGTELARAPHPPTHSCRARGSHKSRLR